MEPLIKGLLTAEGEDVKNKEILQLLEAVWKPSQVAVIKCKGHHRGTDPVNKGNWLADQAAKELAAQPTQPSPTVGPEPISKVLLASELPPSPRCTKEEDQWALDEGFSFLLASELPPSLSCTKEEDQWALDEGGTKGKKGWWKLPDQRLFVPSNTAVQLVNITMRQLT